MSLKRKDAQTCAQDCHSTKARCFPVTPDNRLSGFLYRLNQAAKSYQVPVTKAQNRAELSRVARITHAMDYMNNKFGELLRYQSLLSSPNKSDGVEAQSNGCKEELKIAPLIWWDVKKHLEQTDKGNKSIKQYAVLGHESPLEPDQLHEPVLLNTNAPWSAFLCGSQGSGKSHTLSCMLENCLLDDPQIGKNPHPLAGLVLHYDGSRGSGVCEAAYLCSKVKTTVLVSASNYGNLKRQYEDMAQKCGAQITVQKLSIATKHLDTERVKSLMAVAKEGEAPLYIQVYCYAYD
jgi:hypothetical protein